MRVPSSTILLSLLAFAACSDDSVQRVECSTEGEICADGTVCLNRVCVPCDDSTECGTLACIGTRCRACADDIQCGLGRLCKGGQCAGCDKSADCPDGRACVAAACVPCGSSTDCADGRACVANRCVACTGTAQCDNGKVCVESACVACTSTAQCLGGLACMAGSCAACVSSDDCGGGLQCAGGRCSSCTSRNQCPDGQLCSVAGTCVNCDESGDCDASEACLEGRCGACTKASECRPGQVCREGACGPCGASTECPDGLICKDHACTTCTSSAQCVVGDVCIEGRCRGCASQTDCNPGEACVEGRCGQCTSPDQCAAGDACASGVCGPCTTSAQCRATEICRKGTHHCGQPGAPDHLEYVGGQNQIGLVGTRLGTDLAVAVVDASGEVVPDVELAFTVTQGGGAAGAATVVTDRSGNAVTTWRLGGTAGIQQLVVKRAAAPLPDVAGTGRVTFTFVATGQADHADHLEITAGAGQSAAAGTRVGVDPAVRVVDQYGNGIPSIPLTCTITAGGGSATPIAVTSNADGDASTAVTLGTTPGTNRLVFAGKTALPDINQTDKATATFELTGVTGAADHLDKIAGDTQTAQLSVKLPIDPKVKLVDRFGNPVAGTALTFVATGGVTLGAPTVTTDAAGFASTTFTMGTSAGSKTLTVARATPLPDAAGTGRASVTFTSTAIPGDPDHLELVQGNNQTALAGTRVSSDPTVKVVDQWGNPRQGVSVTFTAGTGALATPATVTTDANGVAATAWTLALRTGAQTLVAARATTPLPDLASTGRATITFTATAPNPTTSAIQPVWMPVSGGTLTITGTNFASDSTVTIGGASVTAQVVSPTQLTATVPSTLPRGARDVVVTSGTTTTAPIPLLMVLKLTPKVDGAISTLPSDADWPSQALVASSTLATAWGGNELRELYLGYDDTNLYIGVVGRAEKHNAIVGYLWHDALSATRPSASGDIRTLTDGVGDFSGDGNGCLWQVNSSNCLPSNGMSLSLDDMVSAGFNCIATGFQAYYAFGRTGNAVSITNATHNAVGARDLSPGNNFGWSPSTVRATNTAQEFALPWTTFARDTINNQTKAITKLSTFVRIVGGGGAQWPNQGLPDDGTLAAAPNGVTVSSVATIDVR